jgi:hypothetical protein
MHFDISDKVGGTIGFVFSTTVATLANINISDFFSSALAHLVLGATGALGGLIITKLWKKYVDKK